MMGASRCEGRRRSEIGTMVPCGADPGTQEVTKTGELVGNLAIFDYCRKCSKNLCDYHMKGRCSEGGKHEPANHGADD